MALFFLELTHHVDPSGDLFGSIRRGEDTKIGDTCRGNENVARQIAEQLAEIKRRRFPSILLTAKTADKLLRSVQRLDFKFVWIHCFTQPPLSLFLSLSPLQFEFSHLHFCFEPFFLVNGLREFRF